MLDKTILRMLTICWMSLPLFAWGQQLNCSFTYSPDVPPICPPAAIDFMGTTNADSIQSIRWNFDCGNSNNWVPGGLNMSHTFPYPGGTFQVCMEVTDTAGNVCNHVETINIHPTNQIFVSQPASLDVCDFQGNCGDSTSMSFTISAAQVGMGPFTWQLQRITYCGANNNPVITLFQDNQLSHTIDIGFGSYQLSIYADGETCPGYSQTLRYYKRPKNPICNVDTALQCHDEPILVQDLRTDYCAGNIDFFRVYWCYSTDQTNYTDFPCQVDTFKVIDCAIPNVCTAGLNQIYFQRDIRIEAHNACFNPGWCITPVNFKLAPEPRFSFSPVNNRCWPQDSCITFTNLSCPALLLPTYDFAWVVDGDTVSTTEDLSYCFPGPGSYFVELYVKDPDTTINCSSRSIGQVIEIAEPPVAEFVASDTTGCASDTLCVSFTDLSTPINHNCSWTVFPNTGWSFAAGTTADSCEPIICFFEPGTYTVTARVSNVCSQDTWARTIRVYDDPQIDLLPIDDLCGDPFTLDLGTNDYTFNADGLTPTFNWTFNSPFSSFTGSDPPPHTFVSTGSHSVSVEISTICGTATDIETFELIPNPTADFTASDSVGCASDTLCVSFTDLSDPVDHNCSWTVSPATGWFFAFGSSPDSCEPTICFVQEGVYTVSATVSNSCSTDTWTKTITVYGAPSIDLEPINDTCGNVVTIDLGPGNYTLNTGGFSPSQGSWQWTFTNGNPASDTTSDPPPVSFSPGGQTHTVQVNYTTVCGTATDTESFRLDTLEIIDIGPDAEICRNETLCLFPSHSNGSWQTQIGTIDANNCYLPSDPGMDTVVYCLGAAACQSCDTMVITVSDTLEIQMPPDLEVCQGSDTICLSAFPPGGTWTGPNLMNDSCFIPNIAGVFDFEYRIFNADSCESRAFFRITVNELPPVSVPDSISFCRTSVVLDLPSSVPAANCPDCFWYSLSAVSGLVDSCSGTYRPDDWMFMGPDTLVYQCTNSFGCINTDTMLVYVVDLDSIQLPVFNTLCRNDGPVPLNGFLPPGGTCLFNSTPLPNCVFDPLSVVGDSCYVLEYAINYQTPCEVRETFMICVSDTLAIDAGNDTLVCVGSAPFPILGFSPDTANINGNNIINCGTGICYDPFSLQVGHCDTLAFTVTNQDGCVSTDYRIICIVDTPQILVQVPDTACVGQQYCIANQSSPSLSCSIDWGDGTISNNFCHTYAQEGSYTIMISCMDPATLCESIYLDTVRVLKSAIPGFTLTPDPSSGLFCDDQCFVVADTSQPEGGIINWYLDGVPIPAPDSLCNFPIDTLERCYELTQEIIQFCTTVYFRDTICIQGRPVADFGYHLNRECSPVTVTVTDQSAGSPDTILWFVDTLMIGNTPVISDSVLIASGSLIDPFILEDYEITPSIRQSVTYSICQMVANPCDTSWYCETVTVLANTMTAAFVPDAFRICSDECITFTDGSNAPNLWWWIGGQPDTFAGPVWTHCFQDSGVFVVYHAADNGCSFDTLTDTITVIPSPQAGFTLTDSVNCLDTEIQVISQASGHTSCIYVWGNGDTSFVCKPVYQYDSPGIYSITQIVTGANGCTDNSTQQIRIVPLPDVGFTLPGTSACPGEVWVPANVPPAFSHTWELRKENSTNPTSFFGQFPNILLPDVAGDYTLKLTTADEMGCEQDTTVALRIHPQPTADFVSNAPICGLVDGVEFTNLSRGVDSALVYSWNMGDNTGWRANLISPYPYAQADCYEPMLAVSNRWGCTDTATREACVLVQPAAIIGVENYELCTEEFIVLRSMDTESDLQVWEVTDPDNNRFVYTGMEVQHMANVPGVYSARLIVSFMGSCPDTAFTDADINVQPSPQADFVFEQVLIEGRFNRTIRFVDRSEDAVRLEWDLGDSNTIVNQTDFMHQYQDPAQPYPVVLVATHQNGCTDTAREEVIPLSSNGLFVPNALAPEGGTGDFTIFKAVGVNLMEFHMAVYAENGNMIWETREISSAGRPTGFWDGTDHGIPLPGGVYVWRIHRAIFTNNETFVGDREGPLLLIR